MSSELNVLVRCLYLVLSVICVRLVLKLVKIKIIMTREKAKTFFGLVIFFFNTKLYFILSKKKTVPIEKNKK